MALGPCGVVICVCTGFCTGDPRTLDVIGCSVGVIGGTVEKVNADGVLKVETAAFALLPLVKALLACVGSAAGSCEGVCFATVPNVLFIGVCEGRAGVNVIPPVCVSERGVSADNPLN